MKRFVEGTDRGQVTLFPECLDDWVDENNPVRVIDAFVDALDLAELGFEGVEPAGYLNNLGVTAFVLKYRLPRETNSPYSLAIHPRQDGQRAMRLIRSRAAEWNLDTNRIGALGFSAGGEGSEAFRSRYRSNVAVRMNCRGSTMR